MSDLPPENRVDAFIHDRTDEAMYLREKIPVAVLGATGSVGQRFVELLHRHPWFQLVAITASEKSVGKTYREAVHWLQATPIPKDIAERKLSSSKPNLPCKIVFSALSSDVAGDIETRFAEAGYAVISCAKNHRMDPHVPMIIPEVNSDHLKLLDAQKKDFPSGGCIITKPNCSVIGLALSLRPLALEFGIESLHVVTLQSTSGAGFPGVPSLLLLDNVIPYIEDEEEKVESETLRVLGHIAHDEIINYPMKISSTCTRVPVTEGHVEVVSIKLKKAATKEEIIRAWREFSPPIQELKLPSSPRTILQYFEEKNAPQPKMHRGLEQGMGVAIGRLRSCSLFDYKFVILSHNTIRGAAGGAILTAELLVKSGRVFW